MSIETDNTNNGNSDPGFWEAKFIVAWVFGAVLLYMSEVAFEQTPRTPRKLYPNDSTFCVCDAQGVCECLTNVGAEG